MTRGTFVSPPAGPDGASTTLRGGPHDRRINHLVCGAACASSRGSSRPAASTSATTSARSASTSKGRIGRPRRATSRSTASSICTPRRSRTTPRSCASASTTRRRCCSRPASTRERCILFRQGDVHEHTELCWLLCSVTALGELNRMHQFRDKSLAQRELVSAGLLFYPVLQAADVLAYRDGRGAGRRGPARAPRADARDRAALQRALRRGRARRARAPDPGGRRARHGPPGPDAQDVDDGRQRGGHGLRARRARDDREEVPARGDRLRRPAGDPPRRGQARRHEPDRPARRVQRPHARSRSSATCRTRAATATSRRRSPRP